MFIDKKVILPRDLPSYLQREIDLLTRYCEEGNELEFDLLIEAFEASVKQENVMGKISNKDLDTVFRYFGWSSSVS